MKANYIITIFFILSFVADSKFQDFFGEQHNNNNNSRRRILHQPLFPYTSSPPPPQSPPPPPPQPPTPDQNHPFFNELPNGPAVDQQTPPSSTTTTSSTAARTPAAPRPSNSMKKTVIAISSAILSLAMLSALAFFIHKQRIKHRHDSQKLVGGGNSQRINEESRMPPSTFLYIGTVEPSAASITDEADAAASSPYRKLNSGKRSSRYRPSPDLQPLPPLTKPQPPPPSINSPPPMSSSDDESHETNFYTPQGSSMSNESPGSRHSYLNNSISQINRVPHSKRTSPKSRLSASSPDKKLVIIPSIKQSLPPSPPPPPPNSSLQHFKPLSYTPKRTKFSQPPPPPDMARLQSISNDDQRTSLIPVPPPPAPPPPPPLPPHPSIPRKFGDVQTYTPPPVPNKGPSRKSNPNPTDIPNSTEKVEMEDNNGSRPKLKPLHWDKVRATSDRATVWDQLNSSSFQLNEDAMESLFGCNSANSVSKEASRKSALPAMDQEIRVLDPKKSQNIAILLRALNVTKEEVADALLDGMLKVN